jgi:hypothetical protein
MLRGNWRGRVLGSGSDVWRYWDERRAGTIGESSGRRSLTCSHRPTFLLTTLAATPSEELQISHRFRSSGKVLLIEILESS